jgi:phosphatidylglycerophosphate synthase
MNRSDASASQIRKVLLIGDGHMRLWGIAAAERLRRALRRAGVPAEAGSDGDAMPADGSVLLARADYLYDEPLIQALVAEPGVVLLDETAGRDLPVAAHVRAADGAAMLRHIETEGSAERPAGLAARGPAALGSAYRHALRKRAKPYLLPMRGTPIAELERVSFGGAYKGVTDFVTKWLWPRPARTVTRWAAELGISANAVTFASLLLVLLAIWLFARGDFLWGIAAAWPMTFLDTVDGKLARVTLTSSKWGNAFDHGIDLVHPPIWYWAWWHGLLAAGYIEPAPLPIDAAFWIVFAGYFVGRAMEGLFIWQFGIELHAWRRIDSVFRLFTARRNPNLAILTVATLLGRPDLGLAMVAIWTVISLVFHAVRILQAFAERGAGRAPRSWLAEPELPA